MSCDSREATADTSSYRTLTWLNFHDALTHVAWVSFAPGQGIAIVPCRTERQLSTCAPLGTRLGQRAVVSSGECKQHARGAHAPSWTSAESAHASVESFFSTFICLRNRTARNCATCEPRAL